MSFPVYTHRLERSPGAPLLTFPFNASLSTLEDKVESECSEEECSTCLVKEPDLAAHRFPQDATIAVMSKGTSKTPWKRVGGRAYASFVISGLGLRRAQVLGASLPVQRAVAQGLAVVQVRGSNTECEDSLV